jgi:glutathione S-transferase
MSNIPSRVSLYELAPSPNCMKARIGLNLKSIPFKKIAVDPNDRIAVVKASGQPLTPAVVADGLVIFDSHAILRWLDGNVKRGPRLFASEYTRMKKIEEWELLARAGFERSLRPMYAMAFGRQAVSDDAIAAANAALHGDTARIEQALQEGPWLVGGELSAADVALATSLFYATQPQHEVVRALPFWAVFQRFDLGADRERTRDWVARVMAWDCWLNPAAAAPRAALAKPKAKKAARPQRKAKSSAKPKAKSGAKPKARGKSARKPARKTAKRSRAGRR